MERKDRIDALGATILIVFSALLGMNQALVKLVNAGFAPVFQAGLRSVCAFIPVLIFALIMKRKLSISDGSLVFGLFSGTLFAIEFCLLFLALEYTTVSRASVFFYTMPFWMAIAAHFMFPGERLTLIRLFGLGLAIVGVAVALLDEGSRQPGATYLGDAMCLIAAVLWAVIALLARATPLSRSTAEMQILYQLFVSGILLTAIAPLFGDLVLDVTPTILGIFAFQVLVIVAIGFSVWFWVLKIYPSSDMASFGFLAPLFGVFFGWLIFDDQMTVSILIGLVFVGAGIYLINQRPKQPSEQGEV